MGCIKPIPKEKLFMGIFFFDKRDLDIVLAKLIDKWGSYDYMSEPMDFTQFSTYYNKEMRTSSLSKVFVFFKNLIDPTELSRIKLWTNFQEEEQAIDGARRVNIDPGLLSLGHIILPTTKNAGHKIPLSSGIYADLTLFYEKKAYRPLPWTYPDFRSQFVQDILLHMREIYHDQLKLES